MKPIRRKFVRQSFMAAVTGGRASVPQVSADPDSAPAGSGAGKTPATDHDS